VPSVLDSEIPIVRVSLMPTDLPRDSLHEYVRVKVRVQRQEQQHEWRQQHRLEPPRMIVSWITAGRRSVAARAAAVCR